MIRRVVSAILTVGIGCVFLSQSLSYRLGTLDAMGPGFVPAVLSGILILLGLVLLVPAAAGRAEEPSATGGPGRAIIAIPAGMIVFALLVERAGLVPATMALLLLSMLSEPTFRPVRVVSMVVGMTIVVYGLFIALLHLPLQAVIF